MKSTRWVHACILTALTVVAVGAAGVASASLAPAASASTSTVQPDPVLVAAGDIACAPTDPLFSGSNPAACQMRATANQVVRLAPNYLLPLGDLQYAAGGAPQGTQPTASDYRNSYNQTWGKISTRLPALVVRPVPGNHEYGDNDGGAAPLASGSTYYTNLGPKGLKELPAGVSNATNDFYSYDIPVNGGRWHVIALDSECASAVGGCQAGSPQETWLRNDLAAHPSTCTIAYWHEPRWTTGGTAGVAQYAAFWNDLVAAKATMVLNGHNHGYQHLAPLDANGNATTGGLSQFVVGTGGKDHSAADAPGPTVIAQDNTDFGVLQLTLHASSASYAFHTTGGATPDAGTVNCTTAPGVPPTTNAPTVSGVAPISGPSSGGTRLTLSGTNFTTGTTVSVGGNPATTIVVTSSTSLTATVPPMTASPGASTVDVVVTTGNGTSPTNPASQFTYTLGTNGYSTTITATPANPAAGQPVTLTATANHDVGPTPYGLSIVDATTNTQLIHVGAGTTTTTTLSPTTPSSHRYIARIDNPNGANTQAVSTPIIITWG